MRRVTAGLLALALLGTTAAAEEIGIAMVVKPQVLVYAPGEHSIPLVERDPIERGSRVQLTRREAFLEVSFTRAFGREQGRSAVPYDGRKLSGVLILVGASEAELGDRALPGAPKVRLGRGQFQLGLLPGEPPIDVDTPETRSVVHGTWARFVVDPTGGTFVAVDEGAVMVYPKAGGEPVKVGPGRWVLVRPGGVPTHAAPPQVLEQSDESYIPRRDFTTEQPRRPPG